MLTWFQIYDHAICAKIKLGCVVGESKHPVADPGGGGEGAMAPPPGPVKIGHKKDGRQRQPHRFHVSRPPPLTRPLDPLLTSPIDLE